MKASLSFQKHQSKSRVASFTLLIALAIFSLIPSGVKAEQLTIHDGSTTNGYVPVYGFYADAYLKSEFVIPASELSAMAGGSISSMTFYASQSSVSWGSANFQVFLKEVGSTSISSFSGAGTTVYTGSLSISSGQMVINFTSPYTYNGGNLLVGIYNTVEGTYVSSSWYGETVSYSSVQGYSYSDLSSVSATQRNFIPKTTFTYTAGGGGGGGGDAETVEIGDGGTTTNSYLPAYTLYNNTLSQQIYTPAEVGAAGTITSLAFYNGGSEKTPNIKLYLVHTDKSAFSSTTDWITVSSSDKVFEGNVTFTVGAWTVLNFSQPFEYNGTSNLAVIVDENMSWSPGLACRVFNSTSNCSMYVYSDGVDYDATSPSSYTARSRLSVKNQIRLGVVHGSSTCAMPTTLAVPSTSITENSASVSWTGGSGTYNVEYKASSATSWTTFATNTTSTSCSLTSLAANTEYQVRVQSVCSGETSGWKTATFSTPRHVYTCPTVEVIGTGGTSTNSYIPSYSYFNYTLSQQIYTPCEVGGSGLITSISFYNGGSTKARMYDIYLTTTDKTTFSSSTDWVSVTNANKVYSGSVSMTAGTWTTFDFDTPFEYDGVHNLVVIMDDNTGSYSSGLSCYVYSTTGSQAMCVYSDGTNYNALTPTSYSGTLLSVKNQLHFGICDMDPLTSDFNVAASVNPSGAGSVTGTGSIQGCSTATISASPSGCYTFSNWTENGTVVSTSSSFSFVVSGDRTLVANFIVPVPTGLTATDVTASSITVSWTGHGESQWRVRCRPAGGSYSEVNVTTNSHTFTGLDEDTDYEIQVRAQCEGNSEWTTILSVHTPLACPIPTDFAVSHIGLTDATLTWNGTGDSYNVEYWYNVEGAPVATNILSEGFEGGSMPNGWSTTGSSSWSVGTGDYSSSTGAHSGSYNAKITHNTSGYTTYLITPSMDLSNAQSATLSFWMVNRSWGGDIDYLTVYYRVGGGSWNQLFYTSSAHSSWTQQTITLTGLAANYQIGFMMTDEYGYGVGLDDIVVSAVVPQLTASDPVLVQNVQSPYTLSNLTTDQTYFARVQADCGNDQSPWSDPVEFVPSTCHPVGSGTASNSYLPSYGFYNYSLTQQIYTPEEVGTAGAITSISFYNSGTTMSRSYDVYFVQTDKTSFTGSTDWITVSDADKVFSGTVNMVSNDWTRFTLSAPFDYDGTSNLAIIFDDNTGSYTNGMTNRVYDAASQAIYVYSDGTNYDPFTPTSYSGTTVNVKNQIIFCVEPAGPCPRPTDVAVSNVGSTSATVSWDGEASSYNVMYQASANNGFENIEEGFESGTFPVGWTYDANAWDVSVGTYHSDPGTHSGSYNAALYLADGTYEDYDLITSAMDLSSLESATLSFWYINESWAGDIDPVTVLYRVNGGAWNQLFSTSTNHETWTQQTINLPNLADNYQICFRVNDSYGYGAGIDDISIIGESSSSTSVSTDPVIVENVTSPYTITGLAPETNYTVQVQSNCGSDGTSNWSNEADFTTLVACPVPADVTVDNLTHESATLSWEGSADSYNVSYTFSPIISSTDFDNGMIPSSFTNDATYPWTVSTGTANSGAFCMASGCTNINSASSTISLQATYDGDGTIEFYSRISSESSWDEGSFSIDGAEQYRQSGTGGSWSLRSFPVTAGTHTFTWTYEKDASVYDGDDRFYIDDIVLSANPAPAQTVTTNTESVTLTGLETGTTYSVRVQADCGENGESRWSSEVSFTTPLVPIIAATPNDDCLLPGTEVTLRAENIAGAAAYVECGVNSTATNSYLPSYSFYNYGLSEMIYTPEELGGAGEISSIQIYMTSYAQARSIDVYMKNTTKSSFSGTTDWENFSSSDMVGSFTTSATGWITIELSQPFYYDGTSNLLIGYDDNSGSYTSGNAFQVYSTSDNQAMMVYSDETNYSPTSATSYTASYLYQNKLSTIFSKTSASYEWSIGSTDASITVAPETTTNYRVTVTSGSSEPIILEHTVKIQPVVTVTSNPESLCDLNTGTATLTATVEGDADCSYYWNNGTESATNDVTGANTYTVTVTTAAGCSVVESYELTAPTYTAGAIASGSQDVCQSETTPLTISSVTDGVTGGDLHYRWRVDGNLLDNSDTAAYEVTYVQMQELSIGEHVYTREVLNGCTDEWFASTGSYTINILAPFPEPTVYGNHGTGNYVICGTTGKLYVSHDDEIVNYWYEDAECTQLYHVGDTVTIPNMTENKTLWHVARNQRYEAVAQEYGTPGSYTYPITAGVSEVQIEVWGAQGGSYSTTYQGGKGGYSKGTLPVQEGDVLHIYVGGQPASATPNAGANVTGGYNGGGQGHGTVWDGTTTYAQAGGGATDVRLNGETLYDRVIVAGGGSGSTNSTSGYAGGGTNGLAYSSTYQATQTSAGSGGSFGQGANPSTSVSNYRYCGAGGGGGWYGGGTYTSYTDSDETVRQQNGGGSGYVWTAATASSAPSSYNVSASYYMTDAQTIAGNQTFLSPAGINEVGHSGNGYARIIGAQVMDINPCASNPVAYTMQVAEPSAPIVENATTYCGLPVTLEVQDAHENLTYMWSTQPDFSDTVGFGASLELTEDPGIYTYYVKSYLAIGGSDTVDFAYTGAEQTFTVPAGVSELQLEVWGAEGGGRRTSNISDNGLGGHGGYSVGTLHVTGGETLNVYVGGIGGYSDSGLAYGGFNGGGTTYASSVGEPAGGGGGATDIRLNGNTLYDRIIVAGGGGGGGEDASDQGGYGGGESGGAGNAYSYQGTQTSAGTGAVFGYGASSPYDGGAGGGGWYGGGTNGGSQDIPTTNSSSDCSGGSGGSGYVWTAATASSAPVGYNVPSDYYLTNAQTIAGNAAFPAPNGTTETGHQGNGYARISYNSPVVLGCESPTAIVTLTVQEVPEITFAESAPQITCGTGTTLAVSNPIDGFTYEWFSDAACTQSIGFGTSIDVTNITMDSTFYVKSYIPVIGQEVVDFTFTGAEQTFTVLDGVSEIAVEVWGAEGGQTNNSSYTWLGGPGGYAAGTIEVTPGDVLSIYVGGKGGAGSNSSTGTALGGWNGGGNSGLSTRTGSYFYAGGGGGATDIRLNGTALTNRMIVAGGGGGAAYGQATTNTIAGGVGGGLNGGRPSYSSSSYENRKGSGGTQTAGGAAGTYTSNNGTAGSLGTGGVGGGGSSSGGGGGAGYYGGGGNYGSSMAGAGGGGSAYIGGVIDGITLAGDEYFSAPDGTSERGHTGNGYARISYDIAIGTTCESSVASVTVTLNDINNPIVNLPEHIVCGTYLSLSVNNPMEGFKYVWFSDPECLHKVHEGTSWDLSGLSNISDTTYYVKACKEAVGSSRADTTNFEFNNTVSEYPYTIPEGAVSVTLQAWGAQGGATANGQGGRGGFTEGTLTNLDNVDVLYVCVGGQGGVSEAGFNGGAPSQNYGAGGGATHIATAPGMLRDLSGNRDAVLVVAGGGGGSGHGFGGFGGGLQAGRGSDGTDAGGDPVMGGAGATAMNGSDALFGGNTTTAINGGGGGGGWYAGENGNSANTRAGGGGGSGYLNPVLYNAMTTAGNFQIVDIEGGEEVGHYGNGAARIIANYPTVYTCESEVVPVRIQLQPVENIYDIYVVTPVADAYEMCEGETVGLYAFTEAAYGDDEIPSIIWYRGNGGTTREYVAYTGSGDTVNITEPLNGEWFYYAYAATDIISAAGEYTLNTLADYAVDRTSAGNFYFDVTTPIEMGLHGIDVYPSRTQGDDVTVYYATRSGDGLLSSSAAWTSLGTYHINYDANGPSTIELNDTITIPAGHTYSFYMKSNNGLYINNINGLRRIGFDAVTGVEVYAGEGTAELNTFPPQTHSPRQFKGGIHYVLTGETHFGCMAEQPAETSVIVDERSVNADSISISDGRYIVCEGQDPITLTAHNAYLGANVEYAWVKETGGVVTFIGSDLDPSITVEVPDTTSRYGVYLHSQYCGNTDTLYTKIIVAIEPEIADITPDTICAFGSLNLENPVLNIQGDLEIDGYRWEISEDGVNFDEFTANTNSEIGTTYNGWYIRFASTSECATGYSNIVQIVVDTAATFEQLETPEPICAHTQFDWAGNTAEVHYQNNSGREIRTGWNLFAGGQLVEPFDPNYDFTYNSNPDYYQYNCYIVTACDSIVSNMASIVIWDVPMVGRIQELGETCAGLPVTIGVPEVTAFGPVDTVGWEYAPAVGSPYFNRLPSDFVIGYEMNGYQIRYFAENSCGSHESNVVQIHIIDRPSIADIPAIEDTLCSGTPFEMTEPEITDNRGVDEYTTGWYLSENEEVAEGENVVAVNIGDPMLYDDWNGKWLHFGATNVCGTRFSNGVKVNLRPDHHLNVTIERQPYGPITESEVVTEEGCFGPDYRLTASSDLSGVTFQWTATTGANLDVTTGETVLSQNPEEGLQRYIVTATESTYGCSATDTVLFRVFTIHTDTTVTVCQSDLPFVYDPDEQPDVSFDRSGSYQVVYQTASGCDSIINLCLNVHYPLVRRSALHFCNNEAFTWRGTTYGGMGVEDTLITSGDTLISSTWRSDMHWSTSEQAWVIGDYCDSVIYILELNISNEPYVNIPQDEFTLPVDETVTVEASVRKDCDVCTAKSAMIYQLYKDDVPVESVGDYGELSVNTYLPDVNHTFGRALTSGHGEIPGNSFSINSYNYDYFYAQFFGEIDNHFTATWREPGEYKLQLMIIRKAGNNGQDFPMTYRYADTTELGVNGYNTTVMGGANGISTDSVFTDTVYIYFHVGNVTDITVDTVVCANEFPFDYHATMIEGVGNYEISTGNEGEFTRYFLNVTSNPVDTTVLTVNVTGDSYELNNTLYEAGNYTVVIPASTGCDSVIVLTVNTNAESNSDTVYVTACHDYTWDVTGTTYDVTGIYTEGEHNLDLTVLDAPYAEATIYVSEMQFPYTYQGTVYDGFGTYRITYPADGDCDSIVDLHIVEASAGLDIDTVSFAAELGEENNFDLTVLGGELNDLKVGIDYEVTRNGVLVDRISDYGSIYFSTEYPDIHRTFGNSITTGTGSIPANTFAVLYYQFDYFYMRFFSGIHNNMTATWTVPGEYKVKFYLRERQGGNDIPLTSNNLSIGGHGSVAGSLIAIDSVVMHYVGDTVNTEDAQAICASQIGETVVYNYHGFEFTQNADGVNIYSPYSEETIQVAYTTNTEAVRTVEHQELFIYDPYRIHDTIVDFSLTINSEYRVDYGAKICAGSSYEDENFTLTAAQISRNNVNDTAVFVLNSSTEAGCDSVVTLTLNVIPNPSIRITVNTLICETQSVPIVATVTSPINFNNAIETNISMNEVIRDTVNSVETIRIIDTIFNISQSTSIYVTSTNSLDDQVTCMRTDTVNIIVYPLDTLAEPITAEVCQGEPYAYSEQGWEQSFDISSQRTWNAVDPDNRVPVVVYDTVRTGHNSCGNYYAVLALTVNPVFDDQHPLIITDEVCQSYGYQGYGYDLTADSIASVATATTSIVEFRHQDISSHNCDSVTILRLTILPTQFGQASVNVCESSLPYEYSFDDNQTVAITTDTVVNFLMAGAAANSCDSIVAMSFVIDAMPQYEVVGETSICSNGDLSLAVNANADSIKWLVEGSVYAEGSDMAISANENMPSEVEVNVYAGTCMASETVVITLLPTYEVRDTMRICETDLPYEWNGVRFEAAGEQSVTLSSVNDCDSTVIMTLIVNPTYNITVDMTKNADELPFTYNDATFELGTPANSSTEFHLYSIDGCDSIVTLNLTVIYDAGNDPFMTVEVNDNTATLTAFANTLPLDTKVSINYHLYKDNTLVEDVEYECGGNFFIGTEFQGTYYGADLTEAEGNVPTNTFHITNNYYEYFYFAFLNARENTITHNFTESGSYDIVFELVEETDGQDFPYPYDNDYTHRIGGKNSTEGNVLTTATVHFDVDGITEEEEQVTNAPRISLSRSTVSASANTAATQVLMGFSNIGSYLNDQVALNYAVYRDNETEPMSMLANVGTLRFSTDYNNSQYGDVLTEGTGSIPAATFHPMSSYTYDYFYMHFMGNTRHYIDATWTVPGTYKIVFDLMKMQNGQDFPLTYGSNFQRLGGKNAEEVVKLATTTLTYNVSGGQNPSVSGISENGDEEFGLYPNPANDRAVLTLGSVSENAVVIITDVNGKEVYRANADDTRVEFSVATWSEGVYFVTLRDNDQIVTKKLVVTK